MNKTIESPGFYATPGLMTDFREARLLVEGLPDTVRGLCETIQGWFLHMFWTRAYEYDPQARQARDLRVRDAKSLVCLLNERDASPLTEPREFTNRIVTECRAHSVMLAALLIRAGIPARARCGFAHYFWPPEENKWEDHWVTEYWSHPEARWLFADAQLDTTHKRHLKLDFDPCDVPRDQFMPATKIWKLCRKGKMDAQLFSYEQFAGLTLIRWNLIRDVAALNRIETLGWDHWGGMFPLEDAELSPEEMAFYDRVAELSLTDETLPELRELYRSDLRLRVPQIVQLMEYDSGEYKLEYSDLLNGSPEKLVLL
ncbi:transglutaminase domain-containing protein [Candidatus Bipolaricaulota bacterium]